MCMSEAVCSSVRKNGTIFLHPQCALIVATNAVIGTVFILNASVMGIKIVMMEVMSFLRTVWVGTVVYI